MSLTTAQLTTLKNDLAANTNTVLISGVATPINTLPLTNSADCQAICDQWYNVTASPAYYIIRTDASVVDIENTILWPNYTPAPAITSNNAAQATAASMYCQGKQFNLQLLLQKANQSTFDATKATSAAGLKDATTQLPSAASFANQGAGWASICPVLQRTCTNGEKLFVTANGTVNALTDGTSARGTQYNGSTGNPDLQGLDASGNVIGTLTAADLQAANSGHY